MATDYNRREEQKQAAREAVEATETATGYVSFPAWNRIQIILSDGEMGVDIPNALEPFGWEYITEIRQWDGDARLVEFEK